VASIILLCHFEASRLTLISLIGLVRIDVSPLANFIVANSSDFLIIFIVTALLDRNRIVVDMSKQQLREFRANVEGVIRSLNEVNLLERITKSWYDESCSRQVVDMLRKDPDVLQDVVLRLELKDDLSDSNAFLSRWETQFISDKDFFVLAIIDNVASKEVIFSLGSVDFMIYSHDITDLDLQRIIEDTKFSVEVDNYGVKDFQEVPIRALSANARKKLLRDARIGADFPIWFFTLDSSCVNARTKKKKLRYLEEKISRNSSFLIWDTDRTIKMDRFQLDCSRFNAKNIAITFTIPYVVSPGRLNESAPGKKIHEYEVGRWLFPGQAVIVSWWKQ
jgi:hypothetical protein